MDYSDLFHAFLSSLVLKESPLEIKDLLLNLQNESLKSVEFSTLKQEYASKIQETSTKSLKVKEYILTLSNLIKELEENISNEKSKPLDLEILLEFSKSLSKTSHPSNFNSEAPIPQDSKILKSLLFNQISESKSLESETKKEEMDWITASLNVHQGDLSVNREKDLSLLDLDL
jgi:hypothetical protein